MSKPNQDTAKELLAEIAGFVLWTDETPNSNEPTELEYFIKGFDNGDKIWKRFEAEIEAKIEALITQAHQKGYDAGFNNQKFISDSQLKRIDKLEAELKREQENG